jgi:hypothetical protein
MIVVESLIILPEWLLTWYTNWFMDGNKYEATHEETIPVPAPANMTWDRVGVSESDLSCDFMKNL